MNILSLKSEMLLPKREIVINKSLVLQQKPAIIASITEQEGIVKLWVFQQVPDSPFPTIDNEELNECVTNRDEIRKRISNAGVYWGHISEITIQGVNLPISHSSSSIVRDDPIKYMKLQHFIEIGVDFSSIEDIDLDELILSEYEMTEGAIFPEIDTRMDMPVSLSKSVEVREVLVEPAHCFRMELGEQDINRSFHDPSDGKEIVYYIDRVIRYDIWKEAEKGFQDEEILKDMREKGLDDAAIEQAKASLFESLEGVCPRGHELLVLQYECPDTIQLNFYTTEFLLSRPKNTESIGIVLMGSSDEDSRYDYPVHSCILEPVPVGFDGTIEVELISWSKNMPDERVEM